MPRIAGGAAGESCGHGDGITDRHGDPWRLDSGVFVIAASEALHAELLQLVQATLRELDI